MTQTTAERVTQANPIQEIISAMNDIQKLIANHDRNCTWGQSHGNSVRSGVQRSC